MTPAEPSGAPDAHPQPEVHATGGADEPPPLLGSWRTLYLVLVVELIVITLASYALSWWAA